MLQAKLAVNESGDEYELEADRVADQVLRTPDPQPGGTCACGGASGPASGGAAECGACREKRLSLQRSAPAPGAGQRGASVAPPVVHDALRSPGQALDAATRGFMEPRLGHGFGGVRVHDDAAAAESCRRLGARAYTVGRDVVFGAGQYAPATPAGRRLIAHELTHVVQQANSTSSAPRVQRQTTPMDDADDMMERKYANDNVAPKAHSCGSPAHCPPGFCQPYHSQKLAEYYLASRGPWLLTGISLAVDSRVVPFWSDYLAGGTAPKNITADFAKDFTNSPSTKKATNFLVGELKTSLSAHPPAVAAAGTLDIAKLIPKAIASLDDPADANQMNFNIPRDIPGNLAGGIGKDQAACPSGAMPSPFNDERRAAGTVKLSRTSPTEITATPSITFTVKDTVDLCPGDCGTTLEQFATVPLSQFEATGIAGDVPFTVEFPAPPVGPFTVPVPAPPPPTTTPPPSPKKPSK